MPMNVFLGSVARGDQAEELCLICFRSETLLGRARVEVVVATAETTAEAVVSPAAAITTRGGKHSN